jgi:3-phosphoshikimate 1-carboxyvinyltransferase
VPLLNEKPYIDMTLSYLKAQGLSWEGSGDYSRFLIRGGASYKPMNGPVPGDFSSAAFPAAAAIISGGEAVLLGLDPEDTQGDKAFFDMLKKMGCRIAWTKASGTSSDGSPEWSLSISRSGTLKGAEFDLNATPDLLPVLAALGSFAEGDTALVNAAHARIKETDRIAVMAAELAKLGVACTEQPDGLVIHGLSGPAPGGGVKGGSINGHGDHRIVMAFAALALGAEDPVTIDSAESAAVTYPDLLELFAARWV